MARAVDQPMRRDADHGAGGRIVMPVLSLACTASPAEGSTDNAPASRGLRRAEGGCNCGPRGDENDEGGDRPIEVKWEEEDGDGKLFAGLPFGVKPYFVRKEPAKSSTDMIASTAYPLPFKLPVVGDETSDVTVGEPSLVGLLGRVLFWAFVIVPLVGENWGLRMADLAVGDLAVGERRSVAGSVHGIRAASTRGHF